MSFRLRSLLPQSLRARLILLVLGSVLLAQAATLTAITHYWSHYLDSAAVDLIATTIRTLRASVGQVPATDRAEFVRNASEGQWRLWSRTLPANAQLQRRSQGAGMAADSRARRLPAPDEADDIRRNLRRLVQNLNDHLGDGSRVALSRGPRPELYISITPEAVPPEAVPDTGGTEPPRIREWLVIPLDRIDPPVATPLIMAWLGGLGMVLLLAVGFSWHLARPLTRLARAADQLAAGQPERVDPSGPHEMRLLGERFNAMLDALAESESVRRTLLAGLPHDLKAPLSRMWLRIEMTDDLALKEGLRKDLRDMQHMVDQFIGFVRGTDPGAYRFVPIALTEWLPERAATWQEAGSPVSLSLEQAENARVSGDTTALGRLLDNLIGNALHHGAPPVEIVLRCQAGQAVLSVSDHGPGIPAERRAEALRPFARLDDARTRSGNVGLGLALADSIARAHGGELELDHAPAGGLQVTLRLPLLDA